MARGERQVVEKNERNKKKERGGNTERKRGIGESEAGNETVLGQSWREKILTTQQFSLFLFNPQAHTDACTHTHRVNSSFLVSVLTGKR